jgi:hypothetical protein
MIEYSKIGRADHLGHVKVEFGIELRSEEIYKIWVLF